MQEKRILITGGAGQLRSYICDMLAGTGSTVKIIDSKTSGRQGSVSGRSPGKA